MMIGWVVTTCKNLKNKIKFAFIISNNTIQYNNIKSSTKSYKSRQFVNCLTASTVFKAKQEKMVYHIIHSNSWLTSHIEELSKPNLA